jgi:predicted permease
MDILRRDFGLAVRTVARNPGFALVVVLTLALGIGATTAIFSLFHQVLVQRLPVSEPDRLVELAAAGPMMGGGLVSLAGNSESIFSYPMFRDLERQQSAFAGLAAHRDFPASIAEDGQTVAGSGMMVSGSYFNVLGLDPALGRLIGPTDEPQVGESAVVVLSYEYWQSRFGGDPNVIGRGLTVNGHSLAVVGVAPQSFRGTVLGLQPRVFVPITLRWLMEPWRPRDEDNRSSHWVYMFARLKSGASLEQTAESINNVYSGILQEVEAPMSAMSGERLEQFRNKRLRLELGGVKRGLLRNANVEPLTMLLGITALVLMIVCVNVANLCLVRGLSRAGELAIRVTIGATRWRLVRQAFLDAGLLAVIGGIASLPVAVLTLRLIGAFLPEQLAAGLDVHLSPMTMWFAAAISVVTVLLFGVAPALQAARTDPGLTVKGAASQTLGGRRVARVRGALATAQIAFSTVLLVLAGLFTQSLMNIARADLGLDIESVVMFTVSPRALGQSPQRSKATFDALEERLATEPGVSGVGSSSVPLLASEGWTNASWDFHGFESTPVDRPVGINAVSSGFFGTLSVPLLTGRVFGASDVADSPRVAVVNESFVRLFGLGDAALGERFDIGSRRQNIEIVGVVADTRYSGVTDDMPPTVFLPRQQEQNLDGLTFYVRGSDSGALLQMIPRVVADIDSSVPVMGLSTMAKQAQNDIYRERLIATLSASFAGLATLLAAIGLYGVLAYNVAQRRRELGLRQALGAKAVDLRALVLKRVGVMAMIGMSIGLAAAIALGRAAEGLLFGLSGNDPIILLVAVAAISLVVLVAAYVPARRAASIDPMVALRAEG